MSAFFRILCWLGIHIEFNGHPCSCGLCYYLRGEEINNE